jgi:hypothetical protein
MQNTRAPEIEGFLDEQFCIQDSRLEVIFDHYASTIESLLYYHHGRKEWRCQKVRETMLRLCEKDCATCFRIFINRLEKYEPYPLPDAVEFLIQLARGLERPIFKKELFRELLSCVALFPQCALVFQDIDILTSLLAFKKGTIKQILKTYKEALGKNGGKYVEMPRNYLAAIIRQGKEDGRWY